MSIKPGGVDASAATKRAELERLLKPDQQLTEEEQKRLESLWGTPLTPDESERLNKMFADAKPATWKDYFYITVALTRDWISRKLRASHRSRDA